MIFVSMALCVDHLSIIPRERRVQHCTNNLIAHGQESVRKHKVALVKKKLFEIN